VRRTIAREKLILQDVYLITDGRYTKIGISANATRRLKEGSTWSADGSLRVLAHFPGGRDLEKHLHERYAHKRMNGEWFDLTPPGS